MKSTLLLAFVLFGGCITNQAMVSTETPDFQAAESPELIVNGGFESPALAPGSWNVFQNIEGWKTSFGPGVEVQNRVAGEPFAGAQHIELDSHASSGIYQDVSTEQGVSYRLTFAFSDRPGTILDDNLLLVVWNGKVIDEIAPVQSGWSTYEYTVSASSQMSRLELRDAGPSNSLGTYVDNVSLRAEISTVVCR
jgi:hypothetical protein